MLTIPRDAVRRCRAVARKTLALARGRGPGPAVLCRSGPGGLALEAFDGIAGVRYHAGGAGPDARLALPAAALAQFEGRTADPVTLRPVGAKAVRATWSDAGAERS